MVAPIQGEGGDGGQQTISALSGSDISNNLTLYSHISSVDSFSATEALVQLPWPEDCTLTKFKVRANLFTLNVNAVFTVRVNGSDTALTVTVVAAQTDYEIVADVTISEDDLVTIVMNTTASNAGSMDQFGWTILKVN